MIDLIELSDGASVVVERITEEEFARFLREGNGVDLNDPEEYHSTAYELQDGRVLVAARPESFVLLQSRQDHELICKDAVLGPISRQFLYEKNTFGSDFPSHTQDLIQEMLANLGIHESSGNLEELIQRVDSIVATRTDYNVFRKRHILHFAALVGDAVIEQYNAEWAMELSKDSVTWNPHLVVRGENVRFIHRLGEDIYCDAWDKSDYPILSMSYETAIAKIRFNLSQQRGEL